MRKKLIGLTTAITLSVLVTSAASADDTRARFDANGGIVYVGASLNPAAPTSSSASFRMDGGDIDRITITTSNEMVLGSLLSITDCRGDGCDEVQDLLPTGTILTSMHDSEVELRVRNVWDAAYTLPTPAGDLPITAQVISGTLSGQLRGKITVDDVAARTSLKISGNGDYVCFSPLPGPYQPCLNGAGTLLPVRLDVEDEGRFKVDAIGRKRLDRDGDTEISGELLVTARMQVDLSKVVRNDPAAVVSDGTFEMVNARAEFDEDEEDDEDEDD